MSGAGISGCGLLTRSFRCFRQDCSFQCGKGQAPPSVSIPCRNNPSTWRCGNERLGYSFAAGMGVVTIHGHQSISDEMKLQAHHRTLDKWFSLYIRRRDTPGFCCTCGRPITFENSDCGHFISRDRIATRWDERNAHAQCRHCNRFQSGKQYEHGLHVAKTHGEKTPDLLLWKSKHPVNFSKSEIREMTKRFREIVRTGPF